MEHVAQDAMHIRNVRLLLKGVCLQNPTEQLIVILRKIRITLLVTGVDRSF